MSSAIRYRNAAETSVPKIPPNCSRLRVVVRDGAVDRFLGDHDPDADRDHDRRVPERKPVPETERALALVHQLARGVIDRGDVIRVEGVAQTQRVREACDSDSQTLVVGGDDEGDEHTEPDDVKERDGHEHQADPPPLLRGERSGHSQDVTDDSEARHRAIRPITLANSSWGIRAHWCSGAHWPWPPTAATHPGQSPTIGKWVKLARYPKCRSISSRTPSRSSGATAR